MAGMEFVVFSTHFRNHQLSAVKMPFIAMKMSKLLGKNKSLVKRATIKVADDVWQMENFTPQRRYERPAILH